MALEDYDATEFELNIGEIIIEEKTLNGWIYGIKKENYDAVLHIIDYRTTSNTTFSYIPSDVTSLAWQAFRLFFR